MCVCVAILTKVHNFLPWEPERNRQQHCYPVLGSSVALALFSEWPKLRNGRPSPLPPLQLFFSHVSGTPEFRQLSPDVITRDDWKENTALHSPLPPLTCQTTMFCSSSLSLSSSLLPPSNCQLIHATTRRVEREKEGEEEAKKEMRKIGSDTAARNWRKKKCCTTYVVGGGRRTI